MFTITLNNIFMLHEKEKDEEFDNNEIIIFLLTSVSVYVLT